MSVKGKIAGAIKSADWQLFLEDYNKQADAVLLALRKAGYAVVPTEPTTDMLRAGAKALQYGEFSKSEAMTAIYKAMIKSGKA